MLLTALVMGMACESRVHTPMIDRATDASSSPAMAMDASVAVVDADVQPVVDAVIGTLATVRFVDVSEQAGLVYDQASTATAIGCDAGPEVCEFTGIHFTGGAAAGDFDGDGFVDLYVTRLEEYGILFRNLGGGSFEDVTVAAGLDFGPGGNGAAWGDIDNDGDLDLYVTSILDKRYYLFVNDGEGGFLEQGVVRGAAVRTGVTHQGFSVAFGDYDRDGFLDIHTTEWVRVLVDDPRPSHAYLLRNLGAERPGYFEDVTAVAGVDLLSLERGSRFTFSSSFTDMDDDGWPDLVIAGDFNRSYLFWNNGDGSFVDGTAAAGLGTDQNGMGSAIGDYDGDGDLDWFVTSIFDPIDACGNTTFCGWGTTGNRLYENKGDRKFSDATDAAGVRDGFWGWGASFLDYDNDGDLDLVMTNGVDYSNDEAERFRMDPMRLWRNDGDGSFTEVAAELGLDDRQDGKGLLIFDFDNDGDQDIFVANHEGRPRLYRNDGGNAGAWLRVRLVGRLSNRDGIGGRVSVLLRGEEQPRVREIRAGSQFLGQNEAIAHFGLGSGTPIVDEVRVRWPSGGMQIVHQPEINTLLVVRE